MTHVTYLSIRKIPGQKLLSFTTHGEMSQSPSPGVYVGVFRSWGVPCNPQRLEYHSLACRSSDTNTHSQWLFQNISVQDSQRSNPCSDSHESPLLPNAFLPTVGL